MKADSINISQILKGTTLKPKGEHYAVCWIKEKVKILEIDKRIYKNVSNSIFFIDPKYSWKIVKKDGVSAAGYILYLSKEILNEPLLNNLHINTVRLFNSGEIPLFKLSPGIEKRTQSILEMIDELLGSQLNHREDALLSLLNTFFIYCDGQCNIKTVITDTNAKTNIVYKFKNMVDKLVLEYHDVGHYARLLNISPKYLNECVKEILSVSSKHVIVEQLLMRSRHELKFSDKSIKEISFELGFSSPDYFSYFFKSHTGITPSVLRKL